MRKLLSTLFVATMAVAMPAAETIQINSSLSAAVEITAAGEYLLQGDGSKCTQQILVAENLGNVTLTLDNVNVEVTGAKDAGVSALVIGQGTTATINFRNENILKSTCDPGCGIEAQGNIVLNGEANSVLRCSAKGWAAAIGSTPRPKGKTLVAGDITINSGIIEALADWESPGIGASVDCPMHNITINGGRILAQGGAQGAGIGTGYSQWGESTGSGTITINGGTVEAVAGSNESSWGADDGLVPLGVVSGTKASVEVKINGGSIKAMRSDKSEFTAKPIAATDKSGTSLVLFKTQLANTVAPTRVLSGKVGDVVLGEGGYGMKDVYTDVAGWLYLYLPEMASDVPVELNAEAGQAVENNSVDNVLVVASETGLNISNAEGRQLLVFDISGRQVVAQRVGSNSFSVELNKGLYCVRIGDKTRKVIIK